VGVIRRLWGALRIYALTAWWGIVAPRLSEHAQLIVVQAVVLREHAGRGQVLLSVRSDVRGWELPGGQQDPGETPEMTVVREVFEETGCHVEVERHVGDYTRTGFRPHCAIVFVCRATSGEARPSSETPEVEWFDCEAVPETLFPWYREPLLDALAEMDTPVTRHAHQGLAEIWIGLRTDFAMRMSDNRAGRPDSA
jgi:8-oxo-dGTP diphosphatase